MINGGVADTLDEAKAAFRAAWDRTGRWVFHSPACIEPPLC